jgi:uncharacterized protein YjbI with pentapeptide repeats
MTKASSRTIVVNQFMRQNLRLFLISVGVIMGIIVLWVIQQNNVNQLDEKIGKLKDNIKKAEEGSRKGNARDQSFTVEKNLAIEKDILVIEKDKITIQNGVYATLVQAIGGIILSITAYVGYCNFRVGEKNLKVTEDKQVTERFSKSIEHLGSEKIDVRLGGVYALEQIAIDSSKYHWTIMEILSAFVREKSKKSALEKEKVKEDIQAALTVMARRKIEQDPQGKRINLKQVNMRFIELQEASINGFNLSFANFMYADFSRGDFSNSDLRNSNLSRADFSDANFSGSDLRNVDFCKANISGANFNEANLSNAYLSGSNLTNANLIGANLSNADLSFHDHEDHEEYIDDPRDHEYDYTSHWDLAATLSGAIMTDARLSSTKLDGADLSKSVGLTKQQLDSAIINEYTELPDSLKPKPQS